jgi:hypothetical protein
MKATGIPPPSSSMATAMAMTPHSSLTPPPEQSSYSQSNSLTYSNSHSKSYSKSYSHSTSHSSEPEPNSASRSSNVRVVVRIRPMNQSERDRRSKTSLYPVLIPNSNSEDESTEHAEAREMDENDPIQELKAADATITTPNGTPTRPRKSFLSRLLTPHQQQFRIYFPKRLLLSKILCNIHIPLFHNHNNVA